MPGFFPFATQPISISAKENHWSKRIRKPAIANANTNDYYVHYQAG